MLQPVPGDERLLGARRVIVLTFAVLFGSYAFFQWGPTGYAALDSQHFRQAADSNFYRDLALRVGVVPFPWSGRVLEPTIVRWMATTFSWSVDSSYLLLRFTSFVGLSIAIGLAASAQSPTRLLWPTRFLLLSTTFWLVGRDTYLHESTVLFFLCIAFFATRILMERSASALAAVALLFSAVMLILGREASVVPLLAIVICLLITRRPGLAGLAIGLLVIVAGTSYLKQLVTSTENAHAMSPFAYMVLKLPVAGFENLTAMRFWLGLSSRSACADPFLVVQFPEAVSKLLHLHQIGLCRPLIPRLFDNYARILCYAGVAPAIVGTLLVSLWRRARARQLHDLRSSAYDILVLAVFCVHFLLAVLGGSLIEKLQVYVVIMPLFLTARAVGRLDAELEQSGRRLILCNAALFAASAAHAVAFSVPAPGEGLLVVLSVLCCVVGLVGNIVSAQCLRVVVGKIA